MTSQKQSLPDTTELMHIWTHRDCGNVHRAYTDSNQMGSQQCEIGKWTLAPNPYKQQLSVTDTLTGKGKICSLQWILTVYITYERDGPMLRGSWTTEKEYKGIVSVCFGFVLLIFCLFVSVSFCVFMIFVCLLFVLFWFGFVSCILRKGAHKVAWVGR